jgi:hypothetical protein
MFERLNQKFCNLDYNELDEQISYGGMISYNHIEIKKGGVLYTLPMKYRQDFTVSLMKINDAVPPHTDSEIKCTINFYIKPELCITKFYRPFKETESYQVPNQTNGKVYNKKDLICIGNFIAQPGDAWLLDVTQIHAVVPVFPIKERLAISVCTDKHTYEEVKQMLHETGNL